VNNNTIDLDISKIEDADTEQLAQAIEGYYKNDNTIKASLAYNWEKNHLYLDGRQWITFDGDRDRGGSWKQLQLNPKNEYIPQPVTNYLFDAYQTLKSYVLKNKPRITVRANTQNHRDKEAAKIAQLCSECNWERLHETYNYEYAASCLIVYGTVFKKDYWDTSFANSIRVPRMMPREITDPNTGMPTGQIEEVQAQDEQGNLLFDDIPLGDVNTSIVEPYRIAVDPMAINLHEARWIMEYSIRPLNWIVENYDKPEPGFTGKAQEVKEEKALPNSMRRFFQLRTSAGVKGLQGLGGAGSSPGSTGEMIENAAVVKEYYERPSHKHPKGRLVVVANGVTLYVGDSPYQGPDQGDWHPYSECRWEPVPGRFWGKSPFDDATEIQKNINSIDTVIILTRKTMAVPQKKVPRGTNVSEWTGRPGERVEYTPGPNGESPETIPPMGVDQSVFQEREQRVSDLKQITGAVDILKGDRPPGVTAASALALLYEVGTGKLFPILDRWKTFIETSQKKQLRLIASKYREPRPEFVRRLMAINKDLTEDQLQNFIGQDLYDNCNAIIEAASSIPKLKAAEHALLLELANHGVLNLENPANRQEFLSRFGIEGFDSNYSKDVQRAQWENDLLDNLPYSPDNRPIVLEVDDHQVHKTMHSERMKEPSFMSLPSEVQQAYLQHIAEHDNALAEMQQQQMMQAAMTGQPPAPPQPNPMQQEPQIRKGSSMSEKTKQMLGADIFGNSAGIGE
jgi:hypothetical protein